ncbi:dynamin family protein [Nocardia seriolae]|uniref:Isoniazid-induced protein IniC n=1 Tax=Nocardia seriolae TaxID=37332 RepID=A0ABC8ALH6_9NOCA|nr:dynamin family protein [Nocardia seriolae]APA95169.1 Isoniazid-induced protein IniC [Nocardia seriolae]MTJ66735.1 Isoniazid-inducible protein iniC [Nocardia seriolae]MTJ73755.1 Isoniazid-inducible protein iniC [Nocardia seriolae]MTJ85429.1 Isoniazid-inducible protein iniC [Nocardia seriolae]MTK29426.1 Isoniazid-inducible protein iniC [Nocardia seriolae]
MRDDASGVGYGLVPETRGLVAAARRALGDRPWVRGQLEECARRLDEPLRVALAGQLKAGKSTLLNALVGQDIAPTDATECTRLVTWYRNGTAPRVTAYSADGARADVVVRRGRGTEGLPGAHGLTFDLSALRWNSAAPGNAPGSRGTVGPREVEQLAVEWPSAELAQTTIIDTPGISSLSRDVSARTQRLLTPGGPGPALPPADAVLYLLRRLDAADVDFLERIGAGPSGSSAAPQGFSGPLGVIGVVSRADEIGAGRIDALHSARDVAARFATELERTGLCQSVIPVAGLLAFAAATLRQREYDAFEALAAIPTDDLTAALLSADRFAHPDLPLAVPAELRAHLAARFGLFGIRLAVTLIRLGVRGAQALAAELTDRSGLDELRTVLDVQFAQRADELKAHSALTALARILAANPGSAADALLPRVRTLLADVHGFAELRLLAHLRSDELPLPPDDLTELHRLIGGTGVAPTLRLGLAAHPDLVTQREVAFAAVQKWRARARHPLADQSFATACLTAARSAEGLLDILREPPTTPFPVLRPGR